MIHRTVDSSGDTLVFWNGVPILKHRRGPDGANLLFDKYGPPIDKGDRDRMAARSAARIGRDADDPGISDAVE